MAKKSFFERLTGATTEDIEEKSRLTVNPILIDESKIDKSKKKEDNKPEKPKIKEKKELSEEEGQLTIDIYQTENDIIIKSTIAGVKSEDMDIEITNDRINIKGTRKKDNSITQENYYYQELYWGPFSRSVILPLDVDADKSKASIKNGILTIKLPKLEKSKTKTIKVKEIE